MKNTLTNPNINDKDVFRKAIENKLKPTDISTFAAYCNDKYEKAIASMVGYLSASGELLSTGSVAEMYKTMPSDFLLMHLVFSTSVLTRHYAIQTERISINKGEMTSDTDIHHKQRVVLFAFFGLLQARRVTC